MTRDSYKQNEQYSEGKLSVCVWQKSNAAMELYSSASLPRKTDNKTRQIQWLPAEKRSKHELQPVLTSPILATGPTLRPDHLRLQAA